MFINSTKGCSDYWNARRENQMSSKKFTAVQIVGRANRNQKEVISNTSFPTGIHTKYKSESRRKDLLSINVSKLIGEAISCSQMKSARIIWIEAAQTLIGLFNDQHIEIDYQNQIITCENILSPELSQMVLAKERYSNPKGETDRMFKKIDFSKGFIDVDQEKEFITCADAIRVIFEKEFINRFEFLESKENSTFLKNTVEERINHFKAVDITSFLINDFKLERKNENLTIVFPFENVIQTKRSARDRFYEGVETFSEDEKRGWDDELKLSYENNKNLFLVCRDDLEDKIWTIIAVLAKSKSKNLILSGEPGVGKTTTAKIMAGALGYPLIQVGGFRDLDSTDLFGKDELKQENGTSVTYFQEGPVIKAIRSGAFLLFDEFNAALPGILMKFHSILDDSKNVMINDQFIRVHPKFCFIGTMNPGLEGTRSMNTALQDRCMKLHLADMSDEKKLNILVKKTGFSDRSILSKMLYIQGKANAMAKEEGITPTSIRRLQCWIEEAMETGELIESSLDSFVNHYAQIGEEETSLSDYMQTEGVCAYCAEAIMDEFEDVEIEF